MKKTYLLLIISLVFLGNIGIANGAITEEYKLLEPLPCIQGGDVPCGTGGNNIQTLDKISFNNYVGYVYRLTIAVAVFLTVVMMVVGGFEYMLSESFTKKGAGKDKMKDAALGLLGVLISYTVLETIDPRLVQIGVNIEPVNIKNLKLEESDQFLNMLSSELSKEEVDSLNKIKALEGQKKINNIKIDELKSKINNTEGAEDKVLLNDELSKLELNNQKLESTQVAEVVRSQSTAGFKSALSFLDDLNNYSGTSFNNKADLESAKILIEGKYNQYSDKMTVADKQQLLTERDFYLSQIDEEKKMMDTIVNYRNTSETNQYTVSNKLQLKNQLIDLKNKYSKNVEINTGNSNLDALYKDMYKSRAQKLNIVLSN